MYFVAVLGRFLFLSKTLSWSGKRKLITLSKATKNLLKYLKSWGQILE